MKIAIMQPTYLPWIGYFALMDRVDKFVFLDTVKFSYQSWQQSNQIKTANGALKLTVPVLAKSIGRSSQLIRQVKIDGNSTRIFPEKHIRAIELNYNRCPHFKEHAPTLFALMEKNRHFLYELTEELILWLREALGITTPILRSSEIPHAGIKAELVASLSGALGADHYLSPPGAKEYLATSEGFAKRNIKIDYHHFVHNSYPQRFGPFLPYMSIIDLLFNMGDKSLEIIRKGCQQ